MSPSPGSPLSAPAGRVLRGGRLVARVGATWLATTVALAWLDRWLGGFSMGRWWQPPVAALLLGLLSGVVWPLVVRIAYPIAYLTLGTGSFLILGAGVLGIFSAIPGVVVTSFATSVVVAVAIAAVSGVVSSVLAIDEDEVFFRRARRRAETAAGGRPQPPGVLFLQIDGLGLATARRAVRDGSMPTLAAWLREDSHVLAGWHTDWSSQTGASVCGILHGSNDDVLGFRWYEKDADRVVSVSHPADAEEVERRHSDGAGLLAVDGASRGNLFSGDAVHRSFTMSSLAGRRSGSLAGRGSRSVGAGYRAYFSNPVNVLRTLGVSVVDVGRELRASAAQRRADVRPRTRRGGLYPLARPGTTVIARDVVVSALLEDMLAGRSVAYADFLGYDEVAHHSGIERYDALEVLRGIDQQIGRLHRATQLAPRPYHLVCLSDHGQTQGWSFAERFGEPIEALVGRLCGGVPVTRRRLGRSTGPGARQRSTEGWQVGAVVAETAAGGGPIARRLRARVVQAGATGHRAGTSSGAPGTVARVAPGVVCVVSGHTAMISFPDLPGRVPLETVERRWPELLPVLVDHPGVGFLLVHSAEHGPVVLGRDGVHRLRTGLVIGQDPLLPYGEHAARLVARVSGFAHCADVVVNSRYDPATDEASPFEPHVGSHGGLGGPQQHGFLLYPRSFAPPGPVLGAEHLHQVLRGWLTDLGHPVPEPRTVPETVTPAPAGPAPGPVTAPVRPVPAGFPVGRTSDDHVNADTSG